MTIEITVPRLGWSMEEGAFVRWLKSEGELVREGDELFELEGDKATQVVESFDSGVLRISPDGPQPGDVVQVGQVLGHLEARHKKPVASQPSAPAADAPAASRPIDFAPTAAGGSEASPPDGFPKTASSAPEPGHARSGQATAKDKAAAGWAIACPSVRRLARELGVDLEAISPGSGFQVSAAELLRSVSGRLAKPADSGARLGSQSRPVTPRARRVARELGVDLAAVEGTGRQGRVREQDVRAALPSGTNLPTPAARQPANGVPGESISATRRVIAQRLMSASHETAPVTLTARADASELVSFREQCKQASAEQGLTPPGFTELFVKLSAAALQRHPALLEQWIDQRLVKPDGIHLAVAVATAQGLVTPVIRNVPALSLRELSHAFEELTARGRNQQLTVEQMQGGGFTVSSLGGYRIEAFTPILNPPQTAILGVGRISEQPVVKQGQLSIAHVVTLSLTFDHRVVDGAPAAAFLTSLCEMIETPLGWLLV